MRKINTVFVPFLNFSLNIDKLQMDLTAGPYLEYPDGTVPSKYFYYYDVLWLFTLRGLKLGVKILKHIISFLRLPFFTEEVDLEQKFTFWQKKECISLYIFSMN